MSTQSAIHECLACESKYNTFDSLMTGTPMDFEQQYCSLKCYEAFELVLRGEAEKSKSLGLTDTDNNPVLSSVPSKESTAQQLLQHFHLKVSSKKE